MTGYIFYITLVISLFIVFVLTIHFYFTKNGTRSVNKILSFLFVLFGIQIFYSFTVSHYAFFYFMKWHKLLFLLKQTTLLIGPAIFLYLLAFIKHRQIKKTDMFHIVPFFIITLFSIIYNYNNDKFIIWQDRMELMNTIVILTHSLVYIIISCVYLKKLNNSLADIIKNIKNSSHTAWFQLILLGFIGLWVLNLNSFAVYMYIKRPGWCAYTGSIYMLTFFLFLNSILFFLLLKPEICYLIDKYKNSPINVYDKNNYLQSLVKYMDIKNPYLEPDITLEKVARDLSMNTRVLSQIINESFKNNFNGYINEYRIKESMRQLSDIHNKKTIQEILYDSGFNSKSAFYTEFKKHTGLTPQEYRAKSINQIMAN